MCSKSSSNLNADETQNADKKQQKITSIWDLGPLAELFFGKKPDRINQDENNVTPQYTAKKKQNLENGIKKVKFQHEH